MQHIKNPLGTLVHVVHRYFIWFIIGSYVVAAIAPMFGLWIRNVQLGTLTVLHSQLIFSLPPLMLASLLLGIGFFNAILGALGNGSTGRGLSLRPVSGLNLMGDRLRERPAGSVSPVCAQDIPTKGDVVAGGERWNGQAGVGVSGWNRRAVKGKASRVGSIRPKERIGLGRRPRWGCGGQTQMCDNFDNHGGLFDGGDQGH